MRHKWPNKAGADFRDLNQEAPAWLERTFEIDAVLNGKRDQKWIDEALASGPTTPLSEEEMGAIRARILKTKSARQKF